MAHSLCVLTAGLLLGQAPVATQDVTVVSTEPVQPGCNCNKSSSGWVQVPGSTQTRTWTKSGTWTQSKGWTWKTTTSTTGGDWAEDRPVLTRIGDRIGELFGGRSSSARQSSGWQSSGWKDEASVVRNGVQTGPVIQTAEPPALRRMPNGKVNVNEPPLLEISVDPSSPQSAAPVQSQPTQSVTVKPASFEPSQTGPVLNPVVNNGKISARLVNKIGHEEDYSWITGQLEMENGAHVVYYATPDTVDRFGGRMVLNGDLDMTRFKSGDLVTVRGTVLQGRTISIYRAQSINLVESDAK